MAFLECCRWHSNAFLKEQGWWSSAEPPRDCVFCLHIWTLLLSTQLRIRHLNKGYRNGPTSVPYYHHLSGKLFEHGYTVIPAKSYSNFTVCHPQGIWHDPYRRDIIMDYVSFIWNHPAAVIESESHRRWFRIIPWPLTEAQQRGKWHPVKEWEE